MARILVEALALCDAFSLFILLVLAIMSIYSWSVIAGEVLAMRRVAVNEERFLAAFHNRRDPLELLGTEVDAEPINGPLWRVYLAGCQRMRALLEGPAPEGRRRIGPKELMDVEDAMTLAVSRESLQMETRLWVLGTIASVSPLMGLFGTVWGVMVCFHDMGRVGNTSLRAVAPGLTVALITTVVGLAVAIPALMGHNYLASRLRLAVARMRAFGMELLTALSDRAER